MPNAMRKREIASTQRYADKSPSASHFPTPRSLFVAAMTATVTAAEANASGIRASG